ncbi:DMT family transporter [Peptococcus simiae]|uniref:DMT family transporter n=1 Tax=Peptococcus simiae TaxID=1643805 RepID=UPI00397FCF21
MVKSDKQALVMGTVYCVLGGICWGISGTTAEYLMAHKGLSADWISVLRMLLGGGIILLYAFKGQGLGIFALWRHLPSVIRVLAFGLIGMNLAQYAYVLAIEASNAGTATMLQYTGPIGVLLYQCLLARRWPTGRELAAIILAVTGTFFIATHGSIGSLSLSPAALFWGLLAALGLIINFITSEPLIHRWGNATATGSALVLAGILLSLMKNPWQAAVSWDLGVFLGCLVLVLVGTIGAFIIFMQGLVMVGSVRASMLASTEPLSAAICSAVFLGTVFTGMDILGFACIMATIFLLGK